VIDSELLYYATGIFIIPFTCSFFNKKFGILISCFCAVISIFLTYVVGARSYSNDIWEMLFVGFVFFPILSFLGFWLGQFFREKYSS
jgi:hypothetical protein